MPFSNETQLEINGRKCNASMTLMFHNQDGELCVVFQQNDKFTPAQWSVSGGKVDIQDNSTDLDSLNHTSLDQDEKTLLLKKLSEQFDAQGLTAFAKGAMRETFEEIGYDLYNALVNQKATLHYFDRNDPKYDLVEANKVYRTEFFYAYLGQLSEKEVEQQLKVSGCTDASHIVIAKVHDIKRKPKSDSKHVEHFFSSPTNNNELMVRPSTGEMIFFLDDLLASKLLTANKSASTPIIYQFETAISASKDKADIDPTPCSNPPLKRCVSI